MESDGVTRFYLLKDEFMGESLSEIHPIPGENIAGQERRDVIDRADIMYTVGGIIWGDKSPTIVIKDHIDTDKKSLKTLSAAAEMMLRKTGLTIVIDRLSPEDMRYAGEDYDFDEDFSLL